MDKTIIVLSGIAEGKNKFSEIILQNNYWLWQINAANSAAKAAEILGCDIQNRDEKYYRSLRRLVTLANEEWGFETNYIDRMVGKFYKHERAMVLIIHGLNDQEFIEELKEDEGVNCIHITDCEPDEDVLMNYDYVLNCSDEKFVERVERMMRVFTNYTVENTNNNKENE